jgi:hypothetical protein
MRRKDSAVISFLGVSLLVASFMVTPALIHPNRPVFSLGLI